MERGNHCFGFLSLYAVHNRLLKTFFCLLCYFYVTSTTLFTRSCSVYHKIQNRINCFLCALVCSLLLVSLKLLCSFPDVKCRSCFPLTLGRNLVILCWAQSTLEAPQSLVNLSLTSLLHCFSHSLRLCLLTSWILAGGGGKWWS